MARYKILIEYDGSRFCGWQRQENLTTVQGSIETALLNLTRDVVCVEGAGRTDAGVHATGQVAHFDLETRITESRLCEGLNHFVREQGISILNVSRVADDFHARFQARQRTYRYQIFNRHAHSSLGLGRYWHVKHALNVKAMQEAAIYFIGHHDFNAFRASECQSKTSIKTLERFDIIPHNMDHGIEIHAWISSRSFLHNQVRIMMGSLVHVGLGKKEPHWISDLLQQKQRIQSGPTAPPDGLYLVEVLYPG